MVIALSGNVGARAFGLKIADWTQSLNFETFDRKDSAELSSDFPHPYYNLGILCRDDGGPDAAAQYFALGLARDQDPVSAHRYLGRLYDELFSDPVRARQHYLAYLKLGGKEEDVIARAYALASLG